MNYLCLSCRAEIPEGDQFCLRCQEKFSESLEHLRKGNCRIGIDLAKGKDVTVYWDRAGKVVRRNL